MTDADERYWETYYLVESDVYHQAVSYRKGDKLTYSRIKPMQLKIAWESYMRMGIVLRPKIILDIEEIMLWNTCLLSICTACMGHDRYDLLEEWKSTFELTPYQYRKLKKVFLSWDVNFCEFSNGQPLLSDYGLEPINKLLIKCLRIDVPEQKLVLIDQMLNVIHMRSDLAELFVEGGSKTLSWLSASPSELAIV